MENEPWYADVVMPALLRNARSAYGRAMRAALEAAGYDDIPGNGLYIIGGLALSEGQGGLGDLIRQLGVSKQTGGQLIDALVSRGYITRQIDPDDRRKLTVELTERGKAAAGVQGKARDAVDAQLLGRVGAADIAAARKTLAALCEIGREAAA